MPLPDLVLDSKIETILLGNGHVEHVFHTPGDASSGTRRVRRVERWARDTFLGRGAYGSVYLERCNVGNKLRAVKEIKKAVVVGRALEYTRELEAIFKFFHSKYSHCFVRAEGWFETDDAVFIPMHGVARARRSACPPKEAVARG